MKNLDEAGRAPPGAPEPVAAAGRSPPVGRPFRERAGAALDFYWDRFLTDFCYHLPLPLLLLFIVGLLSGRLGRAYGLHHVVRFDDDMVKQFFVGASLALVALECLFVGFLLQAPARNGARGVREASPPEGADAEVARGRSPFFRYALGILLCFAATLAVLVAAIVAVRILAKFPRPDSARETLGALAKWVEDSAVGWYQLLGALSAVAAAAVLGQLVERLAREWHGSRLGGAASGLAGRGVDWIRRGHDPDRRPPFFHAFIVLLVALAATWYLATTGLASYRHGFWALVVAFLLPPLALALFAAVIPDHVRALLAAVGRNARVPAVTSHHYHLKAFLLAALGCVAFLALAFTPRTSSPVTVACFLLFALTAVYGFLAYVVHRVLPVLLAGLLALMVLAGTNPYKFRYPALEEYYHGELEEADLPPLEVREALANVPAPADGRGPGGKKLLADLPRLPIDLRAWVASDRVAQKRFEDGLMAAYRGKESRGENLPPGIHDEVGRLKEDLRRNRLLPGKDPRPAEPMLSGLDSERWLLSVGDIRFRHEAEPRKPLVLVAVSGGGVRSAAWTFKVLQELELAFAKQDRPIDFPAHVRIIAGASGGMLGSGCYVTTLPPRGQRRLDPDTLAVRRRGMDAHFDALTRDCLTPIMKQMVFGDVPLFFSPWPVPSDRGQALEAAWRRNFAEAGIGSPLDTTFSELRAREAAGDCPSLVFSPMLVEDGRRLLISNLDLRYVVSNDGNLLSGKHSPVEDAAGNYSHEALELFRMFPHAKRRFPVGTAVRMSASFPFFSPAVSLPTWPRRRVVDAGYYDNYGISLASSWLFSGKHQEWIEANASKVVLIQIRDGLEEGDRRLEEIREDTSSQVSRSVEELTTPLEGLNEGRIGSSSFRNDGQLELLSAFYGAKRTVSSPGPQAGRYFTTVVFEYPGEASLSWYLTERERQDIKDRAEKVIAGKIQLLLEWWKERVPERGK